MGKVYKANRLSGSGSVTQFVSRTLNDIAAGKEVDEPAREFTGRFLANALLVSTHNAWGEYTAAGVPTYAYKIYHNSELRGVLTGLMPFERRDIPGRIRENWPDRVVEVFSDLAKHPAQQRKLRMLCSGHNTKANSWNNIARFLGQSEPEQCKGVWNRLRTARFELVDQILPKPNLTPEAAQAILEASKKGPDPVPPSDDPAVEAMGYSYTKITFR